MSEPATSRYSIVGTAGHIDHGKSALVEALTGTHPDRLREEKERGITIDLGFADTRMGDTHVAFVDVPGHERFVRNMLAGIGGIDAVLLVIAADESVMPQTREHFAICRLLGVDQGVIAITKADLVDPDIAELVALESSELLADTPLHDAPTVVTSVVTGEGIPELRETLASRVATARPRPAEGIVRLPIDRVFSMKGFGTVVTGTLGSGRIRVGDRLEILPTGRAVTVRGIQVHGAATELAAAGQRTALNLQGVRVDDIARGDVLGDPEGLRPTSVFDADLQVLPGYKVEHLQRVRFHHGAIELLGRVAVLGQPAVTGAACGAVQLRLESPYPLAPGDRFILRRYSPVVTIAGGVVLDPHARKRRAAEPLDDLDALRGADELRRLVVWTAATGWSGASVAALRRRLVLPTRRFEAIASAAVEQGAIVALAGGGRLVSVDAMQQICARIMARLQDYHERYALRPAMSKSDLAAAVGEALPEPLLDEALSRLAADAAVRGVADGYAAADHHVALDADSERIRRQVLAAFAAAGLAPAAPAEILRAVPDAGGAGAEVLRHLVREGRLVRIRDDLIVEAEALATLIADLRERVDAGTSFGVADFKEWTGLTRKHSIPLLEYLDQQRVTRRVGDARVRL